MTTEPDEPRREIEHPQRGLSADDARSTVASETRSATQDISDQVQQGTERVRDDAQMQQTRMR